MLATALVAATLSGEGAQAANTTAVIYGASADTGVLDTNGDGRADWAGYGAQSNSLSVGEQRGDGMNLKYFVPFALDASVRAAIAGGATVKLRFLVWNVEHLGLGKRKFVVHALSGGLQGLADFTRAGVEVGRFTPVEMDYGPNGFDVELNVTRARCAH